MQESRETVWTSIYRILPWLKKADVTHGTRTHTFPEALKAAGLGAFVQGIEESRDTELVRQALVELHKKGWIDHE